LLSGFLFQELGSETKQQILKRGLERVRNMMHFLHNEVDISVFVDGCEDMTKDRLAKRKYGFPLKTLEREEAIFLSTDKQWVNM